MNRFGKKICLKDLKIKKPVLVDGVFVGGFSP
jgi:hypothetical protein